MEPGKVLIYRNELLPLTETFILSQANTLRRFQPLFGGLRRLSSSLNLAPHSVVTVSSSESPVEKLKRRVFLRTGYAVQLLRLLETQNPHVIHAHFAIDACAALPLAQKLRLPLVVTLHGYDVSCGEEVFRRWSTSRAYLRRREELWEYAALFICVSEYVQRRAIAA